MTDQQNQYIYDNISDNISDNINTYRILQEYDIIINQNRYYNDNDNDNLNIINIINVYMNNLIIVSNTDIDNEKSMTPDEVFTYKGIHITREPCEITEKECSILGKKPDCITCCGHSFNHESLATWIRKKTTCPLCRTQIVEINIPPV
jgi:hypothetical protein